MFGTLQSAKQFRISRLGSTESCKICINPSNLKKSPLFFLLYLSESESFNKVVLVSSSVAILLIIPSLNVLQDIIFDGDGIDIPAPTRKAKGFSVHNNSLSIWIIFFFLHLNT
jgi:hypothetical protein